MLSPKLTLDMVGTDVEWFLTDNKGELVPCIGIVGGTKTKPLPLISGLSGYTLQEDNVALEWGIPPAKDRLSFVYSCLRAREEIERKLRPQNLFPLVSPSVRFTKEQLNHPQAQLIGCETDFNVWEREENEIPVFLDDLETLRTGGGHVHISYKIDGRPPRFPQDLEIAEIIIMGADLFMGVTSILLDQDRERRRIYGKAGAFRPKPYGVEYRTMSNFWTQSASAIEWVWNSIESLFTFISKVSYDQKQMHGYFVDQKNKIVHTINTGDVISAHQIRSNISGYMRALPWMI